MLALSSIYSQILNAITKQKPHDPENLNKVTIHSIKCSQCNISEWCSTYEHTITAMYSLFTHTPVTAFRKLANQRKMQNTSPHNGHICVHFVTYCLAWRVRRREAVQNKLTSQHLTLQHRLTAFDFSWPQSKDSFWNNSFEWANEL